MQAQLQSIWHQCFLCLWRICLPFGFYLVTLKNMKQFEWHAGREGTWLLLRLRCVCSSEWQWCSPIPLLWKAPAMPSWWDYLPVTSASTQWSPPFALHFLYRHRVENRHCAPDMFVLPPFLRKQLDIKQVSPGLAFSQTFLQSIFVFIYLQWHQNCQRKNKKNIFIFGNVCLTDFLLDFSRPEHYARGVLESNYSGFHTAALVSKHDSDCNAQLIWIMLSENRGRRGNSALNAKRETCDDSHHDKKMQTERLSTKDALFFVYG